MSPPSVRDGSFCGFDFDGTIVSEAVGREANRRWFAHFAEVLDDPKIADLAREQNFLDVVLVVMARLHGGARPADNGAFLAEARETYRTIYLDVLVNNRDVVLNDEVIATIVRLKKEGRRLALVSSMPTSIVKPSLTLLGLEGCFDVVLGSPDELLMRKRALLGQFLAKHGAFSVYVADSEEDAAACEALAIPFVHVNDAHSLTR